MKLEKKHSELIIKSWGEDYFSLKNKIDDNGRLKEKDFINYFGTPFSINHNIEVLFGKTFFYPKNINQ